MYVPRRFNPPDDDAVRAVMAATDFAVLVSVDGGRPTATHLPVLYSGEAGTFGVFRAHFARANPHWRALEAGGEVLVICPGPHGYISPAWYHGREVPTWDYVAVHAWCRPRVLRERAELEALLDELMEANEGRTGTGRRYADYPAGFLEPQLRAIVGVELAIERVEGAFKLSQNRDAADRTSVREHLRAMDDPSQAALADAIERYDPDA